VSSLLVPRSDIGEFRKRYKWMALSALLAFAVVASRLFQLQVLDGSEYSAVAHENIIRRVVLPTTRGVIRDANGKVLASSRPSYDVEIVPGGSCRAHGPFTTGTAKPSPAIPSHGRGSPRSFASTPKNGGCSRHGFTQPA
jgi:hypothetical protein